MSRLEVPVQHRILWATGDLLLLVDLEVQPRDQAGGWHPETFRVDTGTEITTMAAYEAQQLGLLIPANAAQAAIHHQTGLEIRAGFLRFQVVGIDTTEYALACFFLGDPGTPPDPSRPPTFPRKLLQPLGLLDHLRFHFDRDASVGAPYGTMTVEKKTPCEPAQDRHETDRAVSSRVTLLV